MTVRGSECPENEIGGHPGERGENGRRERKKEAEAIIELLAHLVWVENGGLPQEGLESAHASDDVLDLDVSDDGCTVFFPL